MAGDHFERCTKQQLENIYRELNITQDSLDRDVKYLMQWIEQEQHLPNIKDENFLKMFLLRCKNSLERTKKSLNAHFSARYYFPEFYTNLNPYNERTRRVMKTAWLVPSPKLTSAGDRILFYRTFDYEQADNMTAGDFAMIHMMNYDALILTSDVTRKYIFIYDLEKLSLTYSSAMLEFMGKIQSRLSMLDAYPTRIHKIIVLNLHPIFHHLTAVVKRFLSLKVTDVIEFGDTGSLIKFDCLSADELPSDYGGKLKPLEEIKEDWYESLKTLKDWFVDQENLKADLSKQLANTPYKIIDADNASGSFRHFSVD